MAGLAVTRAFGRGNSPVRRIGLLTSATASTTREDDLRSGLRDLGWAEGDNLAIDYRRAGNSPDRLAEMARDLVARRVELIVAFTTTAVIAARNASASLPIVSISADPVANGFAASLRRPGGNVTGISTITPALSGKRLELLKELQPTLRRVAFLGYEPDPTHRQFLSALEHAGRSLSVEVAPLLIREAGQLPAALQGVARSQARALVVQTLLPIMGLGPAIAEFALHQRLPACTDSVGFVTSGGLMSYGYDPSLADRRVALYVDRVLKGGRPAEMPIEMPQKFLLALNLKTAASMGMAVPQSLRLRADLIVE